MKAAKQTRLFTSKNPSQFHIKLQRCVKAANPRPSCLAYYRTRRTGSQQIPLAALRQAVDLENSVNLANKLGQFSERWSPRIVAGYNDNDMMVVKVEGEFVWHSHPDTDDLFLVLSGELTIDMPDGSVTLQPGELFVVPKGVEHRPRATVETHLLIIEPKGTPNTGDPATATAKPAI